MLNKYNMDYIIPKKLIDETVQYLSTRPYSEVYNAVRLFSELKPLKRESEQTKALNEPSK